MAFLFHRFPIKSHDISSIYHFHRGFYHTNQHLNPSLKIFNRFLTTNHLQQQRQQKQQQNTQHQKIVPNRTTLTYPPDYILPEEKALKLKLAESLPLVQDYTQVIALYHSKGLPYQAHRLLIEMSEKGLSPSTGTYNEVIDSYANANLPYEAEAFLNSLLAEKIRVSPITYSTVIKAFCKAGLPEKGENILNSMSSTSNFYPSLSCYNALIDGYAKQEKSTDAQRIFNSISIHGLSPNHTSYGSLLTAYSNNLNKCEEILQEMINSSSLYPNEICYSIVMIACIRTKQCEKALQYYHEMRENHLEITSQSHQIYLQTFIKYGYLEEAMKLLSYMSSYGNIPNILHYSIVMNAYSRVGNLEILEKLFQEIKKYHHQINDVCYSALLGGYAKNNLPNEGEKILNEMKLSGIEPSVGNYSVVINGYSRRDEPQKAEKILQEMKKKQIYPNIFVYNNLIDGYFRIKLPYEAIRIYQELVGECTSTSIPNEKKIFVFPDEYTFNLLIKGCCKNNLIENGLFYLNEMKKMKLKCSIVSYSPLIHCYRHRKQPKEAEKIFRLMINDRIYPDKMLFLMLIAAYHEGNMIEDKLRIGSEMKTYNFK